jgi:formate hydrogenlyase subunit 6/NADH:ubiquinone oxidoreductase subunit I
MGIVKILKQNLAGGSRTLRPEQPVTYPQRYRGALLHDTNRCTGCGTCVYVCSPGAIMIENREPAGLVWNYNAAQCTYCGRCVEYCTTDALSFAQKPTGINEDLEAFQVHHPVEMVQCSWCKKPFIPLPASVLVKLYGDPLPEEIQNIRYMCEKCRNKTTGRHLKEAARGQMARRASDLISTKKGEEKKE